MQDGFVVAVNARSGEPQRALTIADSNSRILLRFRLESFSGSVEVQLKTPDPHDRGPGQHGLCRGRACSVCERGFQNGVCVCAAIRHGIAREWDFVLAAVVGRSRHGIVLRIGELAGQRQANGRHSSRPALGLGVWPAATG